MANIRNPNVKQVLIECLGADHPFSFAKEIEECPEQSVVGAAVIALARNVAVVLATSAEDGGCLEQDIRQRFVAACIEQANVWYFG